MEATLVKQVVSQMNSQHITRRDSAFPYLKNRVLKRLCYEVTVNCSFAAHGCNFTGTGMEVYSHEDTCNFSSNDCDRVSTTEPSNMKHFTMEATLVMHVVSQMRVQYLTERDSVYPYMKNRLFRRLCYEDTVSCSFAAHGCSFSGTGLEVYSHEVTCNFSSNDCGSVSTTEPSNMKRSLGRSMEELILEELECPVCYTCIKPPIRQCFNGHKLCQNCTKLVQFCPICRSLKAVVNNFSMEYFYHLVKVPCGNAAYGCDIRRKGIDIVKHELSCSFVPRPCPLMRAVACKWIGSSSQIVNHCKTMHSERIRFNTEYQCNLFEFLVNTVSYNLFFINGVLFRYSWSIRNENVTFSMNYIEITPISYMFKYEIKMYIAGTELISAGGKCPRMNKNNLQCHSHDLTLVPFDEISNYCKEERDVKLVIKIYDCNVENS